MLFIVHLISNKIFICLTRKRFNYYYFQHFFCFVYCDRFCLFARTHTRLNKEQRHEKRHEHQQRSGAEQSGAAVSDVGRDAARTAVIADHTTRLAVLAQRFVAPNVFAHGFNARAALVADLSLRRAVVAHRGVALLVGARILINLYHYNTKQSTFVPIETTQYNRTTTELRH